MCREARNVVRRALPKDHPVVAARIERLAKIPLLDRSRHVEPEALLRECLDIRQETLSAGQWQIANAERPFGACLIAAGEHAAM